MFDPKFHGLTDRDLTSYSVKPDPAEGCDADYPYDFLTYGKKMCCKGQPADHAWYDADFHQICNHGETFRGKNHLLKIVIISQSQIYFRI